MSGYVVAADAQYLGILLLELRVEAAERGCLIRSTTGEIQHMEREHHHVGTSIGAQGNIPVVG